MGDNVKVLKGPTVGPEGDRFKAGQQVPAHWPDWFIADLDQAGQLTDAKPPAKPRTRKARS